MNEYLATDSGGYLYEQPLCINFNVSFLLYVCVCVCMYLPVITFKFGNISLIKNHILH